jgi:hypothetical protein
MWVTISFIRVILGCTWLLLVSFGLLVIVALNVLAGEEFCCVLHTDGTKAQSQIYILQEDAEI